MKTQRINLLVSPEEKALIDERARTAGLTASELVRRAVGAYDPDADMDDLRAVVAELAAAAERMDKRMAAALKSAERTSKALADKDALRAAARRELAASGTVWPFSLKDQEPVRGSE